MKTAKPVKAVIFDLGRVLIDFDHGIAAKKAASSSSRTLEEIYNFFFDSKLTTLFEEGRISSMDFFRKVKEAINLNLSYEEFLPIWNEIFFLTDDNRAVYDLVVNLRGAYRLALLSNINELHFNYLKKNFIVFEPFDHVLLSFELRSIKPNPLIYNKTLKILRLTPEEVFYTDDRPELIQAARSLGIRGFVFRGAAQLKEDLLSSGVR